MKKWIWIITGILIATAIFGLFAFTKPDRVTANQKVVDISKLYTQFEMTNDLNRKYKEVSTSRLAQIDSLTNLLQTIQAHVNLDRNKTDSYQSYLMVNAELADLKNIDQEVRLEFESQIWNQLNTYILEFGESSSYPIILGSQNNGNVLFVQKDHDITEEMTHYINKKYLGK